MDYSEEVLLDYYIDDLHNRGNRHKDAERALFRMFEKAERRDLEQKLRTEIRELIQDQKERLEYERKHPIQPEKVYPPTIDNTKCHGVYDVDERTGQVFGRANY